MVSIWYTGNRVEIRDLKNETVLFEGDDILWINLNQDGTSALVQYENGETKIINFEGCDRGIDFTTLEQEKLCFIFSLKKLDSLDAIARFMENNYDLWTSFDSDLKQTLFQSYLSKNVKATIQTMKKRKTEAHQFEPSPKRYKNR